VSWTTPDKSSSNGIVQAIASLINQGSNALTAALDSRYAPVGSGSGGTGVVPPQAEFQTYYSVGPYILNVSRFVIQDDLVAGGDAQTFFVAFMAPPPSAVWSAHVQTPDVTLDLTPADVGPEHSLGDVFYYTITSASEYGFTMALRLGADATTYPAGTIIEASQTFQPGA
jgi:hypothetical protein